MLEIKNLFVSFNTKEGEFFAVNDLSFKLENGSTLGIVGESGSGKSVTSMSIMRLLPENAKISGEILLDGENLLNLSEKEVLKIRGNRIAMVFQEPMTSLNPIHTCGKQIMEVMLVHKAFDKEAAKKRALELLGLVGIPSPEVQFKRYPHQMSGGMRQRIMIAMALACEPNILIADEPTTALDVTIQAQILELMKEVKKKLNTSIIMITHDLGIVSNMCENVLVMYAGQAVEYGNIRDIFNNPLHPYTEGLLKAIPRIPKSDELGESENGKAERLVPIEGTVPNFMEMPKGCNYNPRCPYCMDICKKEKPKFLNASDVSNTNIGNGRMVRCFRIKQD